MRSDIRKPTQFTWDGRPGTEAEEATRGDRAYLDCLADIHRILEPRRYLEIGIRHGRSLSLAKGDAVGVDPAPEVNVPLGKGTRVVSQTSDEFFADPAHREPEPFDLVFIDGMHLFEYALRDFINAEQRVSNGSVIVFDDVSPSHPSQAARDRRTRVWTGDVWKIVPILRRWRPELRVIELDTSPTGLVLVTGLDPGNRVLADNYEAIVAEYLPVESPPPEALARTRSWPSAEGTLAGLLDRHRASASKTTDDRLVGRRPRMSVVLISYQMKRELPRTIRSLSTAVQRGIGPEDYEVILIDNGSQPPVDAAGLRRLLPGLIVYTLPDPSPSPCRAVNLGLRMAQGDLIGVMIDGARMASPGLLATVSNAARVSAHAVVGVPGFHLGPKVQAESIHEGYDQRAEDKLLAQLDWERDGYRLFSQSVFAASSSEGWFAVPRETNALFMSRAQWEELGGYDERFVSPGGGLVNLDVWKRACDNPANQIVMLLGEATFHQVHGGIATNNPKHDEAVRGFLEEYRSIRGADYVPPNTTPLFVGTMPAAALWTLRASLGEAVVKPPDPPTPTFASRVRRRLFGGT